MPPMHCPACHRPLAALPDARFCPFCGAALTSSPAAASAPGHAPSPPAERRVVTVLFCDLQGSTALAERLDPEAWAEVMNGAFAAMITPVYRYEGVVIRLLGDAILAFWGAPVAHEDDPARAVQAGLEILTGIAAYRSTITARYGLGFNARVGINTGLVVVGEIGTAQRREYTVMGDAVNVAARMEQTAQPGTVQVAEATYKFVAPLFEAEDLGGVQVKGKAEPVVAFRIHGAKAQPGRMRGLVGLEAPLIGRDAALAMLQQARLRFEQGHGQLVLVLGDAGLGKSRLVDAWRRQWQPQGVQWSSSQGNALTAGHSYEQWRQHLHRLLALPDAADGPTLRGEVDRWTHAHGLALTPQQRYALLSILHAEDDAMPPGMDGPAFQRAIWDALTVVVQRCATTPLVLAFDDLHWADAPSLVVLQQITNRLSALPLLILGLARPDRDTPVGTFREMVLREHQALLTDISLQPLDTADSVRLVNALLQPNDLPPTITRLIVEKAEGNPFFIEEVIRSLLDQNLLTRTGGRWQARPDAVLDMAAIPGNLQGLLAARVDRLDEPARHTLQLAAVIGRTFARRVLQALLEIETTLDQQLDALEAAALIRQLAALGDAEYSFTHNLTQATVYNGMLHKLRRDYHQRVALVLETLYAGRADEQAMVLAHHWAEAGADERVLHYAHTAAIRAARMFLNAEAALLYAQTTAAALRLARPASELTALHLAWGRVLELDGAHAQAVTVYEALQTLAQQHGDAAMECAAIGQLVMLYTQPSSVYDADRAEPLIARGIMLARAINDPPQEARLLWSQMSLDGLRGRPDAAIRAGQASLALARQHNLRERLAFVLNDLALNLRLTSQPDLATARAYATEARALWSELDNLPMLADNLNQEALQEYNQAEFALALRYAADADQASQRSDNGWNRAFAAMVRGHVLTAQGEWGAAQTAWHTAIMYGKEAGVFLGETLFPTWLGNLLRDIGQVEAAHALHRAAHAASSATATMLLGEIEAALALDAFALGEIEVGQGWLRSAQQRPLLDRATPAPVYLAHAAVAAAHATGAWEAALALVLEAERATSQRQRPVYTPTLFLWHAQCLAGLGQFDEAESQFALASRTATNLGMWPIAWQAERSLTTLLAAHGRAADAPRERANVIAQRLADTLTAEQRAVFLRHSAAANM